MKRIDLFVDEVYQNTSGNELEIEELKAEMKSHLLESVHELMAEGKSEQQAIDIAIKRFGGEDDVRTVIGQLFQAQKIFAKRVLLMAISVLMITSLVCAVIWGIDKKQMKENYAVSEMIVNLLGSHEVISSSQKQEIDKLLTDRKQILNAQVYRIEDVKTENQSIIVINPKGAIPLYQYDTEVSVPNWRAIDFGYSLFQSEWFIQMEVERIFAYISYVSIIVFSIYAVLFTIWATINAYQHKRLTVGWVLLFALLNVIGYLLYHLTRTRQYKSAPQYFTILE